MCGNATTTEELLQQQCQRQDTGSCLMLNTFIHIYEAFYMQKHKSYSEIGIKIRADRIPLTDIIITSFSELASFMGYIPKVQVMSKMFRGYFHLSAPIY